MLAVGIAIGMVKGRVLAGFLWGLVLGPIGWLIVAMGPTIKPHKDASVLPANACPYCEHALGAQQSICGKCGHRISWIAGRARKPSRPA